MDLNTGLAIAGLSIFAAIVQSTAGFGFSLMLVPLLSLVIGVRETVVLANLLSASLQAALLVRARQACEWRLGGTLLVGALVGMPLGLLVVTFLSPSALKLLIAVTVLVFTGLLWRGVRLQTAGTVGCVATGLISGILNVSTSMSGPPVVLYLQAQGMARSPFRATLFAYFTTISAIAVILLALAGHFTETVALGALVAIPSLVVGGAVGSLIHKSVPEHRFRYLVYAILVASGVAAIISALVE